MQSRDLGLEKLTGGQNIGTYQTIYFKAEVHVAEIRPRPHPQTFRRGIVPSDQLTGARG